MLEAFLSVADELRVALDDEGDVHLAAPVRHPPVVRGFDGEHDVESAQPVAHDALVEGVVSGVVGDVCRVRAPRFIEGAVDGWHVDDEGPLDRHVLDEVPRLDSEPASDLRAGDDADLQVQDGIAHEAHS